MRGLEEDFCFWYMPCADGKELDLDLFGKEVSETKEPGSIIFLTLFVSQEKDCTNSNLQLPSVDFLPTASFIVAT